MIVGPLVGAVLVLLFNGLKEIIAADPIQMKIAGRVFLDYKFYIFVGFWSYVFGLIPAMLVGARSAMITKVRGTFSNFDIFIFVIAVVGILELATLPCARHMTGTASLFGAISLASALVLRCMLMIVGVIPRSRDLASKAINP